MPGRDAPTVSIIIPVYNDEKHVAQAIESALAQTLKEVEVIVVDDGSTDGTPAVLKRYQERITHIRQENRGLAGARNTGIRASRGKYLCFLDSDDTFTPEKAEIQTACLNDDPHAGLCYGGWLDVSISTGEVLRDFSLARPERDPKVDVLPPHFPVFSALIRREWCDRVGLFDEEFRSVEDSDFWFRLWAAGCVFRRVKCVVAKRGVRLGSMLQNIPVHSRYAMTAYKRHFARMGPRAPRAFRARLLGRLWLRIAGYHLHRKEHDLAEEAIQSAFPYNRRFLCDVTYLWALFDRIAPKAALIGVKEHESDSDVWAEVQKTIGRVLERLPNRDSAKLSRQEMSALAYVMSRRSEAENRLWAARLWLAKSLLLGLGMLPTGGSRRFVFEMLVGASIARLRIWAMRLLRSGRTR